MERGRFIKRERLIKRGRLISVVFKKRNSQRGRRIGVVVGSAWT